MIKDWLEYDHMWQAGYYHALNGLGIKILGSMGYSDGFLSGLRIKEILDGS